MIIIAFGSNVAGPWGTPEQTVLRAISEINRAPCKILKASRLLNTKPFGKIDQPNFVNAAAKIKSQLQPLELLVHLQSIENQAGRVRLEHWGPRTLDLDIIDYNGLVLDHPTLFLPHPGIAERDFVLKPLAEIAPRWRHPVHDRTAMQLLSLLSSG